MAGEFFFRFFDDLEVKPNGEADVLCPFEHDKGFEARPSAHVNLDKGVFHCKTCRAEGRFQDGGLSEIGFVSAYYDITYAKAIKFMTYYDNEVLTDTDTWESAQEMLQTNSEAMLYLTQTRGLTEETIEAYKLGYIGNGIVYPVFVNGVLLDRRIYNMKPEANEPKIKSDKGASALLFPYDNWLADMKAGKQTILCAGENDTLLARQYGFNAVTSTFGEGSFPDVFLSMFDNQTVYVCYDCDEAGKTGALKVAYKLHDAGANVHIVNLGLQGSKEDKDITDFFIKHSHTADDLYECLQNAQVYTGEMYQEAKDEHFPLVNLWDIHQPRYSNKRISSRVMAMGRVDNAHGSSMEVPAAVEWECTGFDDENPVCMSCRLKNKKGWWVLDDNHLEDVLELVETDNKKQNQALEQMIGKPQKCPGFKKFIRAKQFVQRFVLIPDADTEDELRGYRAIEQHAYVVGHALEDGQRYRLYFRRFPHPKTQAIVAVVDQVEDSDSSVNAFKLTPEVIEQLKQFQGSPEDVMQRRFEMAQNVVGMFTPRQVVEAVNIMYHSVLEFKYARKTIKGYPEGLVIGESRTGKSDTAKKLKQFFGIGNHTEMKLASTAGLVGGAESLPNGGHRINWGIIPRNHRGMLFLDELSGAPQKVFSSLTAVRSEGIAKIVKIAGGSAPAKTRMMWISNPRVQSDGSSLPISLYPNGVSIVRDLIGSDEDIARFDFIIILPPNEVYISPFTEEELDELDNTAYRNLIYWAWSRTSEQIKFAPGVEEYIWYVAQELNERYDTNVRFFGPETDKKLARIAVSIAAMCFSCSDDCDSVLVGKCHVDWSSQFLRDCYDNNIFRLSDYVEGQKATTTTNEEVNNVFASLVRSQALLMQTLSKSAEINLKQLQLISGIEQNQFSDVISNLVKHGLVIATAHGITPTLRFRKARDAYNSSPSKTVTPLSQQGGFKL